MRNYPEWMLIYWAGACIGVAIVGMNAWWTAPEMAYGLTDAAPKVVFADAERIARMEEQPGMLGGATLVGVRAPNLPEGAIPWSEVLGHGGALPDVDVDPDADLCIFYTSGTTGFPKGAQLTQRSCVNNLFNMMFSGQVHTLATQRGTGVVPDPTRGPADPGHPGHHAAVPRDRQQLRRLRHHRRRRQDGADAQVGRGRGAEAHRARARRLGQRRAGDVARTGHPSGLRQVRHLQPAVGRRRRRSAAAGPRGQDRQDRRHRPAEHRLCHRQQLRRLRHHRRPAARWC